MDSRSGREKSVRVRPGDLLGLQEIADLMGVAQVTAHRWRTRKSLPAPFTVCSGRPIWTRESIEKWAATTNRAVAAEHEQPVVPARVLASA